MVYTEAKCLCGDSRISWDVEPTFKFRCHCTDENHLAGNGFSNNYYVADLEETLKVLKPGFKHWTQVVLSGNNMTNHFCGECGSLVYRTSSGFPGFALKVGNIDDGGRVNRDYTPDIEIFTRSRAPWIAPVEGATQAEVDFTKEFLAKYFG